GEQFDTCLLTLKYSCARTASLLTKRTLACDRRLQSASHEALRRKERCGHCDSSDSRLARQSFQSLADRPNRVADCPGCGSPRESASLTGELIGDGSESGARRWRCGGRSSSTGWTSSAADSGIASRLTQQIGAKPTSWNVTVSSRSKRAVPSPPAAARPTRRWISLHRSKRMHGSDAPRCRRASGRTGSRTPSLSARSWAEPS